MHSHLRVSSFTKMNPRRLWVMALISQRCLPRLILEKCPSVSEMGTLWPSVRPSVLVSRFWRSRVVQRVIIAPRSIFPHLLSRVRLILVQTSHASIFQAFPRKTKAHLPEVQTASETTYQNQLVSTISWHWPFPVPQPTCPTRHWVSSISWANVFRGICLFSKFGVK